MTPVIVVGFPENPVGSYITHFVWSDGVWSTFNALRPVGEQWQHKRIERPVDDDARD